MSKKIKISESQLKSEISNSVKRILSERYRMSSMEAWEMAQQREATKRLKAQRQAEQGITPEAPKKVGVKRKKKKLENVLGTVTTPYQFTEYLKAIFFDQGKNIGDTNLIGKLIQQLDRALDTSNNKKGAGGCANNHRFDNDDKREEYAEFNEAAREFSDYMNKMRWKLRQKRSYELLSTEILPLLKDLNAVMTRVADRLLSTPQLKVKNNFNTGEGGHYAGFKQILRAIRNAGFNGKFDELYKQCQEVVNKDPLSYVAESKNTNMSKKIRLTESDLHRIIKESVKKVLREWQDLPKFIIKSVVVNGKDVSDEFFSKVGNSFESKYVFASYLNKFLQPYGIKAFDVDTANDFGEEGDEVYINTNSDDDIEVHGGYEDLIGNGLDDDEGTILA